jgi:hypothetical protein
MAGAAGIATRCEADMSEPDHELKLRRARQHLDELAKFIGQFVSQQSRRFHLESDLDGSGYMLVRASADPPPADPFSLLIGECLHNLRSGLDNLAYALARAHTNPLADDLAESSEFPIFGDEDRMGRAGTGSIAFHRSDRRGQPAPGSGLYKIRGMDPRAQIGIEGLQPYRLGAGFRQHELWILHDLDRINKHRLLHTVVAHNDGVVLHEDTSSNVRILAGQARVYACVVETDTVIARIPPVVPIDSDYEIYLDVRPMLNVALGDQLPGLEFVPIDRLLRRVWDFVHAEVVAPLERFL